MCFSVNLVHSPVETFSVMGWIRGVRERSKEVLLVRRFSEHAATEKFERRFKSLIRCVFFGGKRSCMIRFTFVSFSLASFWQQRELINAVLQ